MLTGQPERCFDLRFAGTKASYQYHLLKASDKSTSCEYGAQTPV
jgi:hypothetical protein